MSGASRDETLTSRKPISPAMRATSSSWTGLANACSRQIASDSMPWANSPARAVRTASGSGERSTAPVASSRSSISTTHSESGSGVTMSSSNSFGRSWLAMQRTSANPRVVMKAVRAPRLVSRAFVPRVVPSRTETAGNVAASGSFKIVRIARIGAGSPPSSSYASPDGKASGSGVSRSRLPCGSVGEAGWLSTMRRSARISPVALNRRSVYPTQKPGGSPPRVTSATSMGVGYRATRPFVAPELNTLQVSRLESPWRARQSVKVPPTSIQNSQPGMSNLLPIDSGWWNRSAGCRVRPIN